MKSKIRVLMLEDNPDDATLIKHALRKLDYVVDTELAVNEEEFRLALQNFIPELVLSDHQLPGFNSMEALKIVQKEIPFIPFILVTGTVSEEFAASIIKAGADDYILKNNLKRLPTAISQALEKKNTARSLRQMEEELRVSHNRLFFHIENTPLGFIEWSAELEIKLWSRRAEEIFGWKEEDLGGTNKVNMFSQIYPGDSAWVKEVVKNLITGKIERNTIQYRAYKKGREVIWCEWHNSVLKDSNGKVITIMSLVQDITEKKLAEQQREFDRNNIAALINNTRDLMWSVDRDFKLISYNQAFEEMIFRITGRPIEKDSDVISLYGFNEVILKQFVRYYEKAFSGETFTETVYTAGPLETWAEMSFYPIRKGNDVVGTACFSRDISQKKKEENRLKMLESVITNATDSVLITEASPLNEPGPIIVYANDAFSKMTGYSKQEIIGKTPRMLQGPKSDRLALNHLKRCLEEGEPCEIEIINYKKNGEEFYINIAVSPVTNHDGVITHFIAIERDVTERLKNLEAIKEQNTKLRDIAWMQSHEVRGPLARIKGLINLIGHPSTTNNRDELINYLLASANELDQVTRKIVRKTEEIS